MSLIQNNFQFTILERKSVTDLNLIFLKILLKSVSICLLKSWLENGKTGIILSHVEKGNSHDAT